MSFAYAALTMLDWMLHSVSYSAEATADARRE